MNGLVIGSFDPPHKGHEALILFANSLCERVHVLVCHTSEDERFNGKLRHSWVTEMFEKYGSIQVDYFDKPMPDSKKSSRSISKHWATELKERYPTVDTIVSSEQYGEYLAEYMSIEHIFYDQPRLTIPTSSTKIMKNPFANWAYIPDIVKPYFVKKICVYGPESVGKSTLAKNLAEYFNTVHVPEAARWIMEQNGICNDDLALEDLYYFASQQKREVKNAAKIANKLLFVDTDNITTQIYADVYFGKIPREIIQHEHAYDLYLLLDTNVPWVDDQLRNLSHRRQEMFDRFKQELDNRNINYVFITGDWNQRFAQAVQAVQTYFLN